MVTQINGIDETYLIMLSETNPTSTKATDRNILVIVAEETPWFPWR